MTVIYQRVALIGLGLIAGSMALAIRRGNLAGEVVGTARSAETRKIALEIGLCDRVCETVAETVADADLLSWRFRSGQWGSWPKISRRI